MSYKTDGGTVFTISTQADPTTKTGRAVVTITRSDQLEATIPLADLREFIDLIDGDVDDDDDQGDAEE